MPRTYRKPSYKKDGAQELSDLLHNVMRYAFLIEDPDFDLDDVTDILINLEDYAGFNLKRD